MDRYLAVCATQAPESRIPKCVDVGDTGNTICSNNIAPQILVCVQFVRNKKIILFMCTVFGFIPLFYN